MKFSFFNKLFSYGFLAVFILSACSNPEGPFSIAINQDQSEQLPTNVPVISPTRAPFEPGQLVDYIAQSGDTLPSLAAHFNSTIEEIRLANPIIPKDASTMPPGMPMKIPIYYLPLWGTSHQIIPDSQYVYGPTSTEFIIMEFVRSQPGWLKNYREPRPEGNLDIGGLITMVSQHFSVNPKVFLIFLEVTAGGLTNPTPPDTDYVFDYEVNTHKGVYMQMVWLANELNNGYYGWRSGTLKEFEFPDGSIERPDPWQNAGTVGVQYALSKIYGYDEYQTYVNQGGFSQTFITSFGDPWQKDSPPIPGSLVQPYLNLPFNPGRVWNYTGGPHTGWGDGQPYSAIDFAPSGVKGCAESRDWVTALADGKILRSVSGEVVLDLDKDGFEQTGWVIFYLHISSTDRIAKGKEVKAGEPIGYPSCEGGTSTGTHVHISRKFNGEWVLADSPVPFNLEGWVVRNGNRPYQGSLVKFSQTVIASSKAEGFSAIESQLEPR